MSELLIITGLIPIFLLCVVYFMERDLKKRKQSINDKIEELEKVLTELKDRTLDKNKLDEKEG